MMWVTTASISPSAARTVVGLSQVARPVLSTVLALALSVAQLSPARAESLPLIRDTEIETLLRDYARPIFKAAGLASQNISMRIVRHESFNAFVADGRNVFVNTGALREAKTPNEVIGVLAHETGHITGGHLAALRARIARDQTKALLVSILGIGAMIAGGTSKSDSARELGGVGQGVLLGGNDVLMRGILAERRSQESAADQAALVFLNATRQSGKGLLETFERFAQQEFISDQHQDPFVRSHPLGTARLAQLRERIAKSPYANQKDDPALQLRHDMMRAKIAGYLERPQIVSNRYPVSDTTLPARYARAIAANCSGKCVDRIEAIDALIKEQPNNSYFWELKGSLYFQAGKAKEGVPHLRKAMQLSGGNEPMQMINLSQALLGTEDPAVVDEALNLLRKASITDGDYSVTYHLMAKGYGKKNLQPQAELAAAQGHFVDGNVKQAQIFAKRAQTKFKQGSPEWIRAEDIITYKIPTAG
ncbi:MAG: M48 family metalloprotease [Hyphomicrobiaceae bacterium]